ncbi:MAG: T9SS type A sorting domain-containing protein [Chitinophagales bacterium]|nr:T9SS type A sorting domain-containing protein [Chitinophagales bacterium]
MKNNLLLFLFLCLNYFAGAQAPALQWKKCLGGTGTEYAECVIPTTDGGYAIAGWSSSSNGDVAANYGNYDFWVIKTNNAGTITWQKNYGGSKEDRAKSIIQMADGGYAVVGYSTSSDSDVTVNNGGYDIWVIKINSTGTLLWQKSLGGSGDDFGFTVLEDAGGAVVVGGESQSTDGDISPATEGCCDSWVVKLNAAGNTIVWQNRFGGTGGERAKKIIKNAQGDFIVYGIANSADGDTANMYLSGEYMLLKINSAGVSTAFRFWGGSSIEEAADMIPTSDGGYAMIGTTYSNDYDVSGTHAWQEWWVVKVNASFQLQWQKVLGGYGYDYGMSIAQSPDGNLVVGGYSKSYDEDFNNNKGLNDIWLAKLGNNGSIIWKKNYGGSGEDFLYSLNVANDGTVTFVGATNSSDGDVSGNHGGGDVWLTKTGTATDIEDFTSFDNIILYPNPSTGTLHFSGITKDNTEIIIYDMQGRILQSVSGSNKVDVSLLAHGSYIAELKSGNASVKKRWTKI